MAVSITELVYLPTYLHSSDPTCKCFRTLNAAKAAETLTFISQGQLLMWTFATSERRIFIAPYSVAANVRTSQTYNVPQHHSSLHTFGLSHPQQSQNRVEWRPYVRDRTQHNSRSHRFQNQIRKPRWLQLSGEKTLCFISRLPSY